MKLCPKCNLEHSKPGVFCSRACANSRIFSEDSKKKKSIANKEAYSKIDKDKLSNLVKKHHRYQGSYCPISWRTCTYCKKEFLASTSKSQYTTCSEECFLSIKRKNRAGNKTVYKDELYDSKWEADLAKWLDEQCIEFIRPKKSIPWIDKSGKNRRYFPDFYIPILDLYVDPKNKFCIIDQKEKLDYVSNNINLIYGNIDELKNSITNLILSK